MKTEVYSWRLTEPLKRDLEAEARAANISVAQLLERISRQWLEARRLERGQKETQIREPAAQYIGAIAGGDPDRSTKAAERIRERLTQRSESAG